MASGSGSSSSSGTYTFRPALTTFGSLTITGRENARLGQLRLDKQQELRRLLGEYIKVYRGKQTPSTQATRQTLAPRIFEEFIRFLKASILKGTAKGIAISEGISTGESQDVYSMPSDESWSIFSYITGSGQEVSTIQDFDIKEQRDLNIVVQEHPEIAAQFGLTHNEANAGPNVDLEKVDQVIAASKNAADYTLKRRGMAAIMENAKEGEGGAGHGGRRKARKSTRRATRKARKTRKGKGRKNRKNTRRQ